MQVTPLRPSILCGWFSQNMMRDSMTRCGDFVPRLIPSPKGGLRAALFRARNPLARHGGKRHKAGVTPVVNTASQFGHVRGAAHQSDRGGSLRQMGLRLRAGLSVPRPHEASRPLPATTLAAIQTDPHATPFGLRSARIHRGSTSSRGRSIAALARPIATRGGSTASRNSSRENRDRSIATKPQAKRSRLVSIRHRLFRNRVRAVFN